MCGIVGCAGNLNDNDHKAFRDMLLFDVIRGQDSTGIYAVPYDIVKDDSLIIKDIGHPMNLWDDLSTYRDLFDRRGVLKGWKRMLLGHNRAATVGNVTADNAHPFAFGDIVGVHNGTLWCTDKLEGSHEIDSEQVYYTIHKKGIKHTWANLRGAAALVWYDDGDDTLHMIRNSERPLWLAETKCGKRIYWASEKWMITVAASRNGVQLKDKIEQLPENVHHTFKVRRLDVTLESKEELIPDSTNKYYAQAGFRHGRVVYPVARVVTKRRPEQEINKTFANGLAKADKDRRDKEFILTHYVDYNSDMGVEYAVGKFTDTGERVEIYPRTQGEADAFKAKMDKCPTWSKAMRFILRCRPREQKWGAGKAYLAERKYCEHVGYWSMSKKEAYPLDEADKNPKGKPVEGGKVVEMKPRTAPMNEQIKALSDLPFGNGVLFPIFGDRLVDESTFLEALKDAGGYCAACGSELDQRWPEDIQWIEEKVCLCQYCDRNDYLDKLSLMGI